MSAHMASLDVPPDHFKLLYFASSSSYTSKTFEAMPAPLPLSKLFDLLEKQYPGIKAKVLDSCLVTINLNYVDITEDVSKNSTNIVISAGDEVAIIPPVSSG